MSKRKVDKVIEAHGKEDTTQPTRLEQVWGYNELSKYGTLEADVYQRSLDEMNRTDLEAHARKVGVIVLESTARLKGELVKAFDNYVFYLRKPAPKAPSATGKISDDVRRILAEGR
jgi:hypothetical protein